MDIRKWLRGEDTGLLEEKNARLEKERTGLLESIEQHEERARALKNDVKQLKLDKKIEEEDIKHMLKLKEERREIEYTKKEMEMQKTLDRELAKVKDEHRDKLETLLGDEIQRARDTAKEVLDRLPKIKVGLTGQLSGGDAPAAIEHRKDG